MLVPQLKLQRLLVGLIAALTLAAATALAVGVGGLELKPGRAIAASEFDRAALSNLISQIRLPAGILGMLGAILRIGALVLLPFAVLHFLRSSAARKQVLMQLLYLLLFSAAILSLSRSFGPQQADPLELTTPRSVLPAPAPDLGGLLPEAPRWLITVASVIAAAAVALIGYRLYRQTRGEQSAAGEIAAGAQRALADIEGGDQLENVVLRAYYQLCVSSRRRRGLSRRHSSTAREYGSELRDAGIPASALDQLTGLFEKARYDNRPLDRHDERQAISALRTILRSLGEL